MSVRAKRARAEGSRAKKAAGSGRPVRAVRDVDPMLCELVAAPTDDPAWVYEPKLDGLRVLCRVDGDAVEIVSRNHKAQNDFFPDVVDGLRAAAAAPLLIDGEVVCLDARGRSSFRALQQRFHLLDAGEVRARAAEHPAHLYVFDLLDLRGDDVTAEPLSRRKELLREALRWSDAVRWTEGVVGRGTKLFERACREGEEGIVGKLLASRYVAGRGGAWVKVKCLLRQEFVIGGWSEPQRTRVGLGALHVGYYEGGALRYAGKVGTGFTRETLEDLRARLEAIGAARTPFASGAPPALAAGVASHWVAPKLVAEIAFAEWTQNGMLRQPRFVGLRTDKRAKDVRRERPAGEAAAPAEARTMLVPRGVTR